jgi:S1-C subfamily serine protease
MSGHASYFAGIAAALLIQCILIGLGSHSRCVPPEELSIRPAAALLPHSPAAVAERSLPAVVRIRATRVALQSREELFRAPGCFPFDDNTHLQMECFGGSGVIVSEDGLVLTSSHVVERAIEVVVSTVDRRTYRARVVGADPGTDIAVLRIEADHFVPMPLGDSTHLRVGDVVLAIGSPIGVGMSVTMGVVSGKGRTELGILSLEDFIQTDAAVNPGNSGGPLVNMDGELVGINTAIIARGGSYQNIGFSVPVNVVKAVIKNLSRQGLVENGWLGVKIMEGRAAGTPEGPLVASVVPSSPASRAGLHRGDVIRSINGERIETATQLRNLIAIYGDGTRVKLQVVQKNAVKTLDVTLGRRPKVKVPSR